MARQKVAKRRREALVSILNNLEQTFQGADVGVVLEGDLTYTSSNTLMGAA